MAGQPYGNGPKMVSRKSRASLGRQIPRWPGWNCPGSERNSTGNLRFPSRLVTDVCHQADRVSDTEIGGVRKVTSDTADTVPITPSRLLTRFLASG